jgi:hypothetical protein
MTIRTFQPGDEAAQVSIYNEASAELPKFKPATLDEIRRRHRGADFDPGLRFFAVVDDQPVGYAAVHANGRVSYPWCRKGHEELAEPLFQRALQALRERGVGTAFAAYRSDWQPQIDFFLARGFRKSRDMVNFVVDLADTPTPGARRSSMLSPLKPRDLPALLRLAPEALRTTSLPDLERHFFQNPYFNPDAMFVLRNRDDGLPDAVGMLIADPAYANVKQVDAAMPCFRLGAFGTEGMQAKRFNGLFSFLAHKQDANRLGLDLLGHAAFRLQQTNVDAFAAQAPSDVPYLLRFYESHFRKQGSFPMLERTIGTEARSSS